MKTLRLIIGLFLLKSMAYLCVPPAAAQEFIIDDPRIYDTEDFNKPGDTIPGGTGDTIFSGGDTTPTSVMAIRYQEVKIYPNPAKDRLYIEAESGTFFLYNRTGQKLMTLHPGENRILATLPRGIYFLRSANSRTRTLVLQ